MCIPTCDGAAVIGDAIESVLRQTQPPEELLIVDDASTDDTLAICLSFATPRLRIIENPTRLGLVANHNRAVASSRHPWVKLMGQDDLLLPRCLERSLEGARSGASIIVCGRRYAYAENDEQAAHFERTRRRGPTSFLTEDTFVTASQLGSWVVRHGSANILGEPVAVLANRRSLLAGGGFDGRFVQLWDYERWLRIASLGGVFVIPEELVVFRVLATSASASNHRDNAMRTRAMDRLVLGVDLATDDGFASLRSDVRRSRWKRRATATALRSAELAGHAGDGRAQWDALVRRITAIPPGILWMLVRVTTPVARPLYRLVRPTRRR